MDQTNFDLEEYQYLYNISVPLALGYLYIDVLGVVVYLQILYLVFYIPTAVVGFVGNTTVLLAFIIDRKQLLKVHFNLLIVNLSIIDLLVSVADIPFTTILGYRANYWPKNDIIGCSFVLFDDWVLTLLSMMTLVGISIDRYWAACWSQHYRIHNSRTRTIIFIACIWFASVILILPSFIRDRIDNANPYYCDTSNIALEFLIFLNICGNHVPSIIMLICSFKVYQQVRKRMKGSVHPMPITIAIQKPEMQELNPIALVASPILKTVTVSIPPETSNSVTGESLLIDTEDANTSNVKNENKKQANHTISISTQRDAARSTTTHQSKEAKIFNSLRYVVAAYLILWTPYYIYEGLMLFWSESFPGNDIVYILVSWLFYMSSAVNPFMYAFGNNKIREAIVRVPKFIFRR